MNLPVDLAAASREELIEVVGQLLSYIGTLVLFPDGFVDVGKLPLTLDS